MTRTEAHAILDALVASGATPNQVADAARAFMGRSGKDKATISALAGAAMTAAQLAAAAKTVIDQRFAFLATEAARRKRQRARQMPTLGCASSALSVRWDTTERLRFNSWSPGRRRM
jgi:hypothetical protein